MIEQGALTINGIQDIAATTIQSCWRGYQVRKSFQNRKNLLMRHEQLKDMKKRASAAKQRRTGNLSLTQSPFVRSSRLRVYFSRQPTESGGGVLNKAVYGREGMVEWGINGALFTHSFSVLLLT